MAFSTSTLSLSCGYKIPWTPPAYGADWANFPWAHLYKVLPPGSASDISSLLSRRDVTPLIITGLNQVMLPTMLDVFRNCINTIHINTTFYASKATLTKGASSN